MSEFDAVLGSMDGLTNKEIRFAKQTELEEEKMKWPNRDIPEEAVTVNDIIHRILDALNNIDVSLDDPITVQIYRDRFEKPTSFYLHKDSIEFVDATMIINVYIEDASGASMEVKDEETT